MSDIETKTSPFPRAHEENLTREEAQLRSASVSVTSCEVVVDLSAAAAEGSTTYPVVTRIDLDFSPQDHYTPHLDYLGDSVQAVRINGEAQELSHTVGSARILLPSLEAGKNRVEVESTSRYSRSGEGLHRFTDPADGQVYLYTQYEPADSRRVFPVFEQPDIKTRFTFSITGPETWQLRSTAPEVSRETVAATAAGLDDTGLVTVHFAPTELQSSYITSLLAGPYHIEESTWSGSTASGENVDLNLAVLCRASLAEHLDADEIFTITRQGLDFFHHEFDYAYPWAKAEASGPGKYDQVFVPEYNLGAMENPGLVTFTEAYVFDTAATEAQHQNRANTILHEMAHMWFGDLVTMTWWDDLWLKESFADYMGTLAVDEATDFETAWVAFANGRKGWAYVQDQLPTTHPIVADITDLEAADQNFDGITYAKGASVLKQLAAYAGRDAFRSAARQYFAQHAFGNASLQDFLAVLSQAADRDMASWAEAWLGTSGIPELGITFDDDQTAVLTQSGVDPTTGAAVNRPHVVEVGVYAEADGALRLSQSVRVEVPAQVGTPIRLTELEIADQGLRLILPNEKDLTYAKLSLDPHSVAASLQLPVADPLARATVWAALWSMVRDAELPAAKYVDAVMDLGLRIPEVAVVSSVLRQANFALQHYLPEELRPDWEQRFAYRLTQFLAEATGDVQRAAARTLATLSRRHSSQLELISALLDGRAAEFGIDDLDVDEELRWAFLQALAAHGQVDATQIQSELDSRDTARARIAARLALAARPLAEVKQEAFEQALEGTDADGVELSNDHLSAVVEGFGVDTSANSELTGDYVVEYFNALEQVWDRMTQGQATRVVEGLFPGSEALPVGIPAENHPVALLCRRWLELHDEAPAALRRIIIEQQDHLLRALAAQQAARG